MTVSTSESAQVAKASAEVSGELYRASKVARRLSITARNSRAMVLRVGDRAAGMNVLAEYFAELSLKTIDLSHVITEIAVRISANSVAQWRLQTLMDQLQAATRINKDPEFSTYVVQRREQGALDLEELRSFFEKARRRLENQLGDIRTQMQAARVVAVNFRLEATQTGEFERMLRNMAESIEGMALEIQDHVHKSLSLLRELRFNDAVY